MHLHLTRRQDLQDAFDRHAPLPRRIGKTGQGAFTLNKTYKTLSNGMLPCQDAFGKHEKTHSLITRRTDLQDAFDRHAPLSRCVWKTRQDAFAINKTPRPTRRFREARSLVKTRSENTTRRIRSKLDAKTYKTLSIGTLPCQDAFGKHDKTHSLITRCQDLQKTFDRHAPLSRPIQKTRPDAFAHNKTPRTTKRFW